MLNFKCPHCGKAIKVQDNAAGKKGKCPGCGKPIDAPRSTELTDSDMVSPSLWEKVSSRYAEMSKNQQVGVVLAAVAVPFVGLLVAVAALSPEPAPKPNSVPATSAANSQVKAAVPIVAEKPAPVVVPPDEALSSLLRSSFKDCTVKFDTPVEDQDQQTILVQWTIEENLSESWTKDGCKSDIKNILEAIDKSGINFAKARMVGAYPLVDKFGNVELATVVNVSYKGTTIDKINFENVLFQNMYAIADDVWIHPTFQD